MIVNSWKNTTPICGFCNEIMTLDIVRSGFVYKCPKCKNSISEIRYEQMLDKISDIEDAMHLAKEIGLLTGKKFDVGNSIKCEIIEDKGDGKMTVEIRNLERDK